MNGQNPFPGLRPFESHESHLYFGRDDQIDELLKRLEHTRFLAVVGTSGSGKSSLVRAGLLPALHRGHMAGAGSHWRVALFRPGDDPIGSLAQALKQPRELIGRSSMGLVEAARGSESHDNLLIVVDQFEELFRFKPAGAEHAGSDAAAAFVKLLLRAAEDDVPVFVVLTMRSDYLGVCAQFRGLPEALNSGQYLIPRLTRDQLAEVIEGPVAVGGADITPRLVQRLLNDVGDDPDQLPVLQHALMRTWSQWAKSRSDSQPLDLPHYEATGGMAEALNRHADEVYKGLSNIPGGQDIARKLFQRLTEKGVDQRENRCPTSLGDLCAVAQANQAIVTTVIDQFRAPGTTFLNSPDGAWLREESMIDISHESLIRLWRRLRTWVDEEADSAETYKRLAREAELYERKQTSLWRDPSLQLALDWRDRTQPNQAWAARYAPAFGRAMQYLEQSQQAKETAMKRRRHQRQLLGLTVIMLVLMLILYDLCQNFYSNYFYLSAKPGPSENVELYQGNPETWFNISRYSAETDYRRWQIEPSMLFNKRKIQDYHQMNSELINILKPIEKLRAYWKSGNTDEAFSTILSSIEQYPERKQDIIGVMSDFRSLETLEKLKYLLHNPALADMHGTIVDVMTIFPNTTIIESLTYELSKERYSAEVRRVRVMVEALESISHTDFSNGDINKTIKSSLTYLLNDQLKEEEKRVRLIAARTLMWLGDQRGVDELISLAKDAQSYTSDDQPRIGLEALEALTGNRNKEVIAFLGSQLDEKIVLRIRRRVIDALAQIGGSDVIKMLKDLIDDESVPIRQKAVQALGRTGTPIAVPDLFDRLHHDRHRRDREEEDEQPVRRNIVEALGRLMNNSNDYKRNNTIREYLLMDLLSDFNPDFKNPMVRTITEVLGSIGNATTYNMLMNGTNNFHKIIIIDVLEALDDIRAIDYLNNLLKEETSNNSEIKQRIAVTLGRLGDASAVTHLKSVLHTTQERSLGATTREIRLSVVMGALGRLGHKDALEPLQKMVQQQGVDRQDILYLSALEALGRLGDARALDDLIAWLQQGDSLMRRGNLEAMVGPSAANWRERRLLSESGEVGSVRQGAVEVLGAFDSIRPLNLLLARLSDGSTLVQRGAARALGRLGSGDIRAVDLLIAHVGDGDRGVRQNAAEALGQLGHPKAVAPLIALLQDSQDDVRQAAAEALGRLGDDRALQPLLSGFKGGQERRKDGVEDARRAALLAYAKIGRKSDPEQTTSELQAIFNNNSEHKRIRLAAAVALLEIQSLTPPDAEIMQFLAEVSADGSQSISNRRELSEMLGEFPSEPGRHILLQLLDDTNLSVLETAIKSLGQSKAQDMLPTLHHYLKDKNFRLQKAAAEALAAIASAASIDVLAASLNASDNVSISTRLACLQALYHTAKNPETGNDGRVRIIDEMLQAVKKDEAILGIRTYNLLGDLQARQALDHLQKRLDEEVVRQHEWRRKQDTSQEQAQPEPEKRESARFKSSMAFELAYNIARIDPNPSGLRLLDHDLTGVRQGAWQGLGRVGSVELIEQLRQKLKTSEPSWFQKLWGSAHPFFRYAAYRAIDHILLRLEAEGDSQDLERLKLLVPGQVDALCQPKESLEQGICRRVQWTIAQLEVRGARRESPTAADAPNQSHRTQ